MQGVWFRGWTQQQAQALNLDGWVKNNHDGSVEGIFRGKPEAIEHMIKQCWSGPPLAKVTGIYESAEHTRPEPGFHQRATDK